MRIAIIGAGISGIGATLALKARHDVTLFEQAPRAGGHANTAEIIYDGLPIAVDTGFIVFNEHNYPNFTAMLAHLGVSTRESDMSFSVSDPDGFEWSSNGLSGLFAWKRNAWRPDFLCMLGDIVKFSAAARADIKDARIAACTLEEYVASLGIGRGFLKHYLLPMGAAIWSTPEREMLRYPAESFLRFFDNHRLLHAERPKWRTVVGGSQAYVRAATAQLGGALRTITAVTAVRRAAQGMLVQTEAGVDMRFDHVVFACHADQAQTLLKTKTPLEQACLAAIRYAPNTAYLHRDDRLMPKRRAAWASWNYLRGGESDRVCVSYYMNALQGIDPSRPLFVTLNPANPPAPTKTFGVFNYDHPQFDLAALQAQKTLGASHPNDGVSFAGAWLGHGFHEDGLASGLRAAQALGGAAPWRTPLPTLNEDVGVAA